MVCKKKFDITFKIVNEHNYNYPENPAVEIPEDVYKKNDKTEEKIDEFMGSVNKAFDEIYLEDNKKKEVK